MRSSRRTPAGRKAALGLSVVGALVLSCFGGCLPRGDLDATGTGSENLGGSSNAGGAGNQACKFLSDALPRVGEGSVAFEAESPDGTFSASGVVWSPEKNDAAKAGGWLTASTTDPFATVDSPCDAPRVDYTIDVAQAGTYFVWLKGGGRQEGGQVQLGLDGIATKDVALLEESADQWLGSAASGRRLELRIPAPGRHTFHLWLREGTPAVDQIYLTRDEDVLPIPLTDFLTSPVATRLTTQFNRRGDAEGWVGGPDDDSLSDQVDQGRLLLEPSEAELIISHYERSHDAEALHDFEIVGSFPVGLTATVYFARGGDDFVETDSVTLAEIIVGGAQTLLIDLAQDPDFSGLMAAFRVVFTEADGPVEVDSMRFVAPPLVGVDPDCLRGIQNAGGNACCPLECGVCGGDGCGQGALGPEVCCAAGPLSNAACRSTESPCKNPR